MPNLVPSISAKLEAHRLAGIETGAHTLHPYYQGYSLANIPGAICRWASRRSAAMRWPPGLWRLSPARSAR